MGTPLIPQGCFIKIIRNAGNSASLDLPREATRGTSVKSVISFAAISSKYLSIERVFPNYRLESKSNLATFGNFFNERSPSQRF
jgi:hypothetical protein